MEFRKNMTVAAVAGMTILCSFGAFDSAKAATPAKAGGSAGGSAVEEKVTAEQLMKEAHLAMFYAADDGVAEVEMTIVNSRGKERLRQFTMMRLDVEEGGRQKYYTYFRKPHDVSRLSFMVHKLPGFFQMVR